MKNIVQILTQTKVLEEYKSKYNGHMQVVRDFTWGLHIRADGLTQTSGVVNGMWKSTFRKITSHKSLVTSALILGLGGGTVAKLIRKNYPNAQITGVDIEPVFIEWGEKYFDLEKFKVKTIIADAYKFVSNLSRAKPRDHYDLIVVDIYQGRDYPEKFEDEKFVKLIHRLLSDKGLAVFNRLYSGDERPAAMRFLKKLENVFAQVDPIYPTANVMFFCKK